MEYDYDVVIVGGGITGLATAVALKGVKCRIFEKARDLQPVGAAIGLFPNGLAAVEAISPAVHRRVMESCIASDRFVIRDAQDPEKVLQDISMNSAASGGHPSPQYLVWYLLQQYLADELPAGTLQLGTVVDSFLEKDGILHVAVSDRETGEKTEVTCRVVVGADGIHSTIRRQLFGERETTYHEKMMFRAVLDLNLLDDGICPPAGVQLSYKGDEEGKLFSFRETAKGILTFTSMAKFDEPIFSQDAAAKKKRLKELFSTYPVDVQQILDKLPASAIYENAVYDIEVLECWSKGSVVLIGDAAHAMTPGLGQGANQGLEDAIELANVLSPLLQQQHDDTIPAALHGFCKSRIDRVKAVHAASRDRTAMVNTSTNKTAAFTGSQAFRANEPVFLEQLYSWKPSSS